MVRVKVIKLKRWKVRVYRDYTAVSRDYTVIAVDAMDARIIAFALNGGFSSIYDCMSDGDIESVKTCTKIIGQA